MTNSNYGATQELLLITCKGRKYLAEDSYWLSRALELEDTGTAINNPRNNFIINNFEHYKLKRTKAVKHRINTTELLYSLSCEMRQCELSPEDEQFIDDIMGNDPMCML